MQTASIVARHFNQVLAVAVLSLGAASAMAQAYTEGSPVVQAQAASTLTRAEVQAQAASVQRVATPEYREDTAIAVQPAATLRTRADVKAEAIEQARAVQAHAEFIGG